MVQQMPKMSARVVNAIRNLREAHGSTSKEIMNYIMSQCNVPESTVQRQMQTALKRGLEYGILMKNNGHYFLNTETEMNLSSTMSPMERSRKRRRTRSRRRKVRRRSRGKRRRRSRYRRRQRRRSTRSRRRPIRTRRMGRGVCRCTKRGHDVHVLSSSSVVEQPRMTEDDACSCEKDSGSGSGSNWSRNGRNDEARGRSLSRSRSLMNSGRDRATVDHLSVHDQD